MGSTQRQIKGFWLRHALAIISQFLQNHQPSQNIRSLSAIVNEYVRAHKEMGKNDRQGSLEIVYFIMQNFLSFQKKVEFLPPSNLQKFSYAHLLVAFYLLKFFPSRLNENYPSVQDLKQACQKYQVFFNKQEFIKKVSLRYSFDDDLLKSLIENKLCNPKEIIRLVKSLRQKSVLYIRPNLQKTTSQKLLIALKKQNIEAKTNNQIHALQIQERTNFFRLPSFQKGEFEVQDLGSQMLSFLVRGVIEDSFQKKLIIDTCAGAGGKTLHLCDLFQKDGKIIAFDKNQNRLQKIFPRIKKSGCTNIQVLQQSEHIFLQNYRHKGDVVLVDAPCSGSGVCRRHPENSWRFSKIQIENFSIRQKKILENYAVLVKKKGHLIYATCSIWIEENEKIADWFSTKFKNQFCRLPAAQILEKQNIKIAQKGSYLNILPHEFNCDAFFAAVWQKN